MEDYRSKSFWLSSREYHENPPLTEDIQVDVAIVGGGFTGLTTAHFLKKQEPSLKVALLEAEVIGFGASGRNAGFSMTLFGFTMGLTALNFGKKKAREAHIYMEKAVDLLKQVVEENNIDCDYEHPGFLRVATSKKYEKRIKKEINLAHSLGIKDIEWIEKDQLAEQVRSPLYLGAWWEPRCGLLNPAKLAWGLKDLVVSEGTQVYERSPITGLKRGPKLTVETPQAKITTDKLVLATNAYSHLVPKMKRKQVPLFTHIVLTEPLQDKHLKEIGWQNRQGIETARNLVHYYRLTADNRLLMGGRSVSVAFGKNMDKDLNEKTFQGLIKDVHQTFPVLKEVNITHKWGGPVSIPVDLTPALGYLGDKRITYSIGCVGHGVSMTHLNGWTLSDLVLGKQTERTEVFFVNRRVLRWPPEPIRFVLTKGIKGALDLGDKMNDPRS
jgi:glycine/D-amino acid oxidase-like deaminating enzyme